MEFIKKPRLPKITQLTIRLGNQVNLGNFNLFKQDITAVVEVGEDDDVEEVIRATKVRLAKSLINKETATQVTNQTKDGFK